MPNSKGSCPLWGAQWEAIEVKDENRNDRHGEGTGTSTVKIISERAGGEYCISNDGLLLAVRLELFEKARLTSWLVEQRMKGNKSPLISKETVGNLRMKRPLPVHERAERLLRYIEAESDVVGATITFRKTTFPAALAWSESTTWDEVDYLFDYLKEMGWAKGEGFLNGGFYATVSVEGHSQIASQVTNVESSQAFVAMWFHESMNEIFEDGMRPSIETAGYSPVRIDQKEHINKIDDEIIAEIRRSRFLVADFTQGSEGARGGVYYEAGFAHALGIPVIFTCRQSSLKDLHFDTEHYNHIVWTDEHELREKLTFRILAVIGEGPNTSRAPSE